MQIEETSITVNFIHPLERRGYYIISEKSIEEYNRMFKARKIDFFDWLSRERIEIKKLSKQYSKLYYKSKK